MMHEPRQLWLHPHNCACETCEPYRPSEPAQLTAGHFAMLGFVGFVAGAGASAIYDLPGTVGALAAIAGFGL